MNSKVLQIIAKSGLVPLRTHPEHASELKSMLLYGEMAETLAIQQNWVQVLTVSDNLTGWVDRHAIDFLLPEIGVDFYQSSEFVRWPYASTHIPETPRGCYLPVGGIVQKGDGDTFKLLDGTLITSHGLQKLKKSSITATARSFLGTPYLYGGRTDTGIDAAGLIQTVHLLHNLRLPRFCRQQAEVKAFTIEEIQHAEPASIIYFSDDERQFAHAGLLLDEGEIIHASGMVRIENINPTKRFDSKYPFNERLAGSITGIQPPVDQDDTIIPIGDTALS